MTLNLSKAYTFYVNNISKSCNNKLLDENSFKAAFTEWLTSVQQNEIASAMNGTRHIPILTNCKNSVYLEINEIITKIQNFKK